MAKITQENETSKYSFIDTSKNPDFIPGVVLPCFPCQERTNSSQTLHNFITGKPVYEHIYGFLETSPKWITRIKCPDGVIYRTNNLKSMNYKRNKRVDQFMNVYDPLFRLRKVSILFVTLTRSNFARLDIFTMLEVIKKQLKGLKWSLRGYIWVMEISPNEKIEGGYHLHYHIALAVDRVPRGKLKKKLILSDPWGQRAQVRFVEKSVKGYMTKYMSKGFGKVSGHRMYGSSRVFS